MLSYTEPFLLQCHIRRPCEVCCHPCPIWSRTCISLAAVSVLLRAWDCPSWIPQAQDKCSTGWFPCSIPVQSCEIHQNHDLSRSDFRQEGPQVRRAALLARVRARSSALAGLDDLDRKKREAVGCKGSEF